MRTALVAALLAVAFAAPARAQHDHVDVYSSEDGGGELVADWEFEKKVNTFESFCAGGLCLFSTINPAFLSPEVDDAGRELYALEPGTRVSVEIVAADTGVALSIDGKRLRQPGDFASLGAAPFHNHPSWQLVLPEGTEGDFEIAYKLTAPEGPYGESRVYGTVVTNEAIAVPTPCPAVPCPADCDDDGEPTAAELAGAVQLGLDGGGIESCRRMDENADGGLTIEEIVAAVDGFVAGCPPQLPATLAAIQDGIFTPTCLSAMCHNAVDASGDLVLQPGLAAGELVGVVPDVAAAADAGLLRVTAGDPDLSFLYHKLVGPRPEWGSRMPLDQPCLPPQLIDQVRRWIAAGAAP